MRSQAVGLRFVAAALLVGALGCSKCGKQVAPVAKEPGVERVLPKGAVAAVVVPNVERLGQKLQRLEALKVAGFVAQLQGFGDGKAFADALVAQLGVDVRSAQAMAQAGLAPARPLGAAVLASADVLLALPVADEKKLDAALGSLASRRLGAGVRGDVKGTGPTVVTFSTAAGVAPVMGYALAHGFALVATGPAVAKLSNLAALGEGDSLAKDAVLDASRARLPADFDAFAWAPNGSPALLHAPVTSALVTLTLSPTALVLEADGPLKPERDLTPLFSKQPCADTSTVLPDDAFLVFRSQGSPAAAAPFVADALGPLISRVFADAKLDVKAEILDKLKPGASFSLSLAPKPPMDRGLPSFDIRRTNPFSYAHLSGVAEASGADVAVPTLEKVATVSPRFGAQITKQERQGKPVFVTTWAQGEGVHFAVAGERVFFGSPIQRVEALLSAAPKAKPPLPLTDDAAALTVDLQRLATSVRALPESAWGLGGFAMKATTVRWLEATDDLTALTVGVNAKPGALQAKLTLALTPPPAAAGAVRTP